MKKTLFSLLLVAAPLSLFAQLLVESNGNVTAGSSNNTIINVKLNSSNVVSSGGNNCGVYGRADNTNNSGLAYGVFGWADHGGSGSNMGVIGMIGSLMNGAGVYGSAYPVLASSLQGAYAGYFYGDAKVTGTMTVNSLVQTSDLRLKRDIMSYNSQDESVLERVLDMNVIKYSYKDTIPSLKLLGIDPEGNSIRIDENKTEKRHIGLIAQELQDLFPELVEEGQDGYLGINYVELVPVLIRAIQELKAELDVTRSEASAPITRAQATTDVSNVSSHGNVLYQNKPNPFNEQTTIRFSLADDARDASICIFDMQGKMLKNLPVSSGMESVSVNGYELGKGMFLYSLIVNGQEIDTKRMVISK